MSRYNERLCEETECIERLQAKNQKLMDALEFFYDYGYDRRTNERLLQEDL